jgi:hypothetical protein
MRSLAISIALLCGCSGMPIPIGTNDPLSCTDDSGCHLANATSACVQSLCAVHACNTGFADCNANAADGCEVNLASDALNCGACGVACMAGQNCMAGVCIAPNGCGACNLPHATAGCHNNVCTVAHCDVGWGDCDKNAANGCETDLQSDPNNCGACGAACAAGVACTAGACGVQMPSCTDGVKDGHETDVDCGGPQCMPCMTGKICLVDADCIHGDTCTAGICQPAQTCFNVTTDPLNCGACGNVCSSNNITHPTCSGGVCNGVCNAGYADCNNNKLTDGCETNLASDPLNCGACGVLCPMGGTCHQGVCTAGQPTCTDGIKDGNETDVDCGGPDCPQCNLGQRCNVDCDCNNSGSAVLCINGVCSGSMMVHTPNQCYLPNATGVCVHNACTGNLMCYSGYGDCDHNVANGCEADFNTDSLNCGGCGVACAMGQMCQAGVCTPAVCQILCTYNNGICQCVNNMCVSCTCNVGYADCNNNHADGCETNVTSDVNNCGACGLVCSLAHATPACTSGVCNIHSCSPGYGDCNGNAADGCEVNLASDANNCGTCANVCPMGQACMAGVCVGGGCGVCAPPNATGACVNNMCTIQICNQGYADCDANVTNGCETLVANDPHNCGACGVSCAAGHTCLAGVCQ